ncbi:LysR family transcriptional regulator [Pseudomonas sp. FEN]|uniref:LysR family transcriptional regulator n=1 Tax=Pseudomonas sp. FEN TaxID=2767468 RepID=UPI00174B1074|nr:LysR family transcriptional regulator [Pseudomonas sp. FEN]CAD5201536.1 Transcriptional regulator, LysR family [Pseudomonas sp. FEN]
MVLRALPPLSKLKVFEEIARLQSFKLAAEKLHLTQSAISHQIASLERYLGAALFYRLPGRVALSEKGSIYFPVIKEALECIELTTDLIRERQS